ncbi:MAG: hypothetical protein SH847_16375 [Roseiflexaceae bacterium]|nr:hypothetical protein [Roseiflexaceae bacterium]
MPTPLAPDTLDADRAALLALRDLTDYTAVNPLYATESLISLAQAMDRALQATQRARKALAAARDAEIAATREFHNAIIGAKAAVIAQYGNDSPAVQAIGLKKKSERKRPSRRIARGTEASV